MHINVIGAGWLGLPLVRTLVERGHTVAATSRSPQTLAAITAAGAAAVPLTLPQALPASLDNAPQVLILTLPPGGRRLGAEATAHYLACLACLRPLLGGPRPPLVLYTSSTSVYGGPAGALRVTEDSPLQPDTHSARAVVAAEEWLAEHAPRLVVLRLAGLFGPDRHPGRFFGGRGRAIPAADAPVNLVHRDDVIAAIRTVLDQAEAWPSGASFFNVCAAAHPTRGAFYEQAAAALGLEVAGRLPGGEGKTVVSDRLRARGWQPRWDDLALEL